MGANLGSIERLIWIVLGVGLMAFGRLGAAPPNVVLASIGACLALTGLIGFCPACAAAGRRPRPKR